MKIATFGDSHCHNFKEFDQVSDITGSTRLDKIIGSLEYMRDYCIANGIRNMIFTGDLHHTRRKVDTVVYNATYDSIKSISDAGIELVMVVGNHDQVDNSDNPAHSLHAFKDLENVYVYDKVDTHYLLDGLGNSIPVLCVPYSKNVEFIKMCLQAYTRMGANDILAAHLGLSGAFVGKDSYAMADAFTIEDLCIEKFKYVTLGHYHKRQFIDDLPNVFYCGSPIQHSFNDEGTDPGFYVMDTDKRWDVQFVPIPSPKFHTLTKDNLDDEWDNLQEYADRGDYVRAILPEDFLMEFNATVPSNLMFKVLIEKEYKQETRVDVKVGMSYPEIISKFAQQYNPEAEEVGLTILSEVEATI